MFTAKKPWIFSLFILVLLLTSLAIVDTSQAALLSPVVNTPLQAATSGRLGRELQVNP
jgi:hypothetical protein